MIKEDLWRLQKILERYTYELLAERGVTIEDIAELVFLCTKTIYAEFKT